MRHNSQTKKHLPPNTFHLTPGKGFTLIELMVAISIVAILATVGLVVFSNTQKQARDSRRTQDIASIANALQVKRPAGSIFYPGLVGADFANGNVPVDPKTGGTSAQFYCLYYLTTVPPAAPPAPQPANWGTTACPAVGSATTVTVNSTTILNLPSPATVTSWIVCAALEGSANVVCDQSKL